MLNGIAVSGEGSALVVGSSGAKWRLDAEGVWADEYDQLPFSDLHGAWFSPDGSEAVAVGGNFNAPPASGRVGVIAYWGLEPLPATFAP